MICFGKLYTVRKKKILFIGKIVTFIAEFYLGKG